MSSIAQSLFPPAGFRKNMTQKREITGHLYTPQEKLEPLSILQGDWIEPVPNLFLPIAEPVPWGAVHTSEPGLH
jgi:hypothetical protein